MTDAPMENSSSDKRPIWLLASISDLPGADFEEPVRQSRSASSTTLSQLFAQAAGIHSDDTGPLEPRQKLMHMLAAVMSMNFKPKEKHEPFGAMVIWSDSRRTAIPQDFLGEPWIVLAEMARRATHPVLKARLSDVCWLLDRKKGAALASIAIGAYCEVVVQLEAGALSLDHQGADEIAVLSHEVRDFLRRALSIGRAIGWDKQEVLAARTRCAELRKRSVASGTAVQLNWFSDLDLDFQVSKPAQVARDIEAAMPRYSDTSGHVELWRICAHAYRAANREQDAHRCRAEAAECLVRQAELPNGSALAAMHWMSAALAELHGIPGKRERRTELRHRLIDLQAKVPEEMSSFSHSADLSEVIERIQNAVTPLSLSEKLLALVTISKSPNPDDLKRDAQATISEHPLTSLFGAAHLDHEGKAIHRTEGGNFGDGNQSAIAQQIAQSEAIRRQLVAYSQIDVIRREINSAHYITDEFFCALLSQSPFISPGQVLTFARGVLRFFQGDFASALHILTPLLENSLRHVLKAHGHDVTVFDDATQTQQDKTISSLFETMRVELDAIFGKELTADIENLFLKRPGPAVRHKVAHGLIYDGTPFGADAIYACWLIFQLCCIPLIGRWREIEIGEG